MFLIPVFIVMFMFYTILGVMEAQLMALVGFCAALLLYQWGPNLFNIYVNASAKIKPPLVNLVTKP